MTWKRNWNLLPWAVHVLDARLRATEREDLAGSRVLLVCGVGRLGTVIRSTLVNVLVRVLLRNRTNSIPMWKEIYYKEMVVQLWRQRSSRICHLQAGDPGKLVV